METILLIEDNKELLSNTEEILELAGYKVYTACNGIEGVEVALQCDPDLIISDIMMPKLDGFGVLHLIQKQPLMANIPFIFLTAKSDRNDFRKGMEMGADDFITKPFNDTELLNAIERQFQKLERIKDNSNDTIAQYLKQSNYETALNELLTDSKLNKYKKKQIIFEEDNHPQYVYYLKSGMAKSYKTNEGGKELTIQLYAPGDFIGYIAIIEKRTYQFTAQAMDDCEVILIARNAFIELIKSNTAFSLYVVEVLAKHNSQKAERMINLAYNSLRKRVSNSLLLLKNTFIQAQEEPFIINITREELANISGTTTESLIRTLSDFKDEKLVEINGRMIKILDENKLKNLIN